MATPPKTPTGTPTPPRRKPAARKPAAKPRAPKATAAAAEATPAPAATPTPKAPVAKTAPTRTRARKAPGRPAAKAAPAARAPAKPKTPSRTTTAAKAVARSTPVKLVADTREKVGDPTFFGALIGGIVAIGAAVTGIFFATRKSAPGTQAHQADGTDSSASFNAGIADEGTIPE